jgi:hypothetical protein
MGNAGSQSLGNGGPPAAAVGAAVGGAGVGGGGSSPPRPLSSLAVVKSRTSGLRGDAKLSKRKPRMADMAYCHNSHGLMMFPDTKTINPSTGNPYEPLLKSRQVPKGCSVVTSALVGDYTNADSFYQQVFLKAWADPDNCGHFSNIVRPKIDKIGEKARKFVRVLLGSKEKPTSPDEATTEINVHPDHYLDHVVFPYLSFKIADDAGKTIGYEYRSSGIFECGVICDTIIKRSDSTMPDSLLRAIFKNSLFPAADELIADVKLTELRYKDYAGDAKLTADEKRYLEIEKYIFDNYMCSQEALFIAFPGAHYALSCRELPTTIHLKLQAAVYEGRPLSDLSLEVIASAKTQQVGAFAYGNVMSVEEEREALTAAAVAAVAAATAASNKPRKNRRDRTNRRNQGNQRTRTTRSNRSRSKSRTRKNRK